MPNLKVKFPEGEYEVPAYELELPMYGAGDGHAIPGAVVKILKPEPLRGYVFTQDGEGNWQGIRVAVST
jgi:hypothetical protein